MIDAQLSMEDFTKYFERNKLGRLYFPNNLCYNGNTTAPEFNSSTIGPFHIELSDLYTLVTAGEINGVRVPSDDIVGVIAFGSAVRHPSYERAKKTRKKYLLFGPKVTKTRLIPIQPTDTADFLVITGMDLIREQVLEPVYLKIYNSGTWIQEGGIHLVNRGANQVVSGVQGNDTVSRSALREGVPVFYNERLDDVVAKTGITRKTPRVVMWDEDHHGYLVGKIE